MKALKTILEKHFDLKQSDFEGTKGNCLSIVEDILKPCKAAKFIINKQKTKSSEFYEIIKDRTTPTGTETNILIEIEKKQCLFIYQSVSLREYKGHFLTYHFTK